MAFILEHTPAFARKLKKLTTKNQLLIPIITTKLKLLAQNPIPVPLITNKNLLTKKRLNKRDACYLVRGVFQ